MATQTKHITVRMSDAEHAALVAEAKRRDRSLNYIARECIREGLGMTGDEEGEEADDEDDEPPRLPHVFT